MKKLPNEDNLYPDIEVTLTGAGFDEIEPYFEGFATRAFYNETEVRKWQAYPLSAGYKIDLESEFDERFQQETLITDLRSAICVTIINS